MCIRDSLEVVNEVRLVEISALRGEPSPVGCAGAPREGDRSLEPEHAREPLGRHADLRREHLDEATSTEAEVRGDIADRGVRPCEPCERQRNGRMTTAVPRQPLQQYLLEHHESRRRRRLAQPVSYT